MSRHLEKECHPMAQILDIAQVGVTVSDRIRWEKFARHVLGLPTFRSADGAVTYCRIDGYHHRRHPHQRQ
jgi:catechol-2,3-dioxygenase